MLNVQGKQVDAARTKQLVLVELVIFFTLAGITALLFQPLMGLINKNIIAVQSALVKNLEKNFLKNRPIRYSSMSPSLIGSVEIRGITIGAEPEPLANIDSLYLSYSLWDIIRGKGIVAIRKLVINKPEITYHVKRDSDLADLFSPKESRKKNSLVLPLNCLASLRNGTVLVVQDDFSLGSAGISLEGEMKNGLIRLDGEWHTFPEPVIGLVSTEGSAGGEFSYKLNDGSLQINVDSIAGSEFRVEKLQFAFSFFEDKIVFERNRDSLPLELMAVYYTENRDLSVFFSADRFIPENMVQFSGSLEPFRDVLALGLSGTASCSIPFSGESKNKPTYRFNLAAEYAYNGSALSIPVRNWVFEGEGNSERLSFSRFILSANRGEVRYEGDLLFKPFLPQGMLRLSGFSITGDGRVDGVLAFSRNSRGFSFSASPLSFGTSMFSSLTGEYSLEENGGNYTVSFNQAGSGGRGASFKSRGFLTRQGLLEGSVELENINPIGLAGIVRPFIRADSLSRSAAAQKINVTADLIFQTDFNRFSFHTQRFLIDYGNTVFLSASVLGTENNLRINDGRLLWQQDRAQFGFAVDYSNFQNLDFDCTFLYRDFNYAFTGKIINLNTISLQGPNNLLLTAQKQGRNSWSGSAAVHLLPIPYRSGRAYLSLETTLVYRNPDFWNLNLHRIEIQESHSTVEQTRLYVHGMANQNGFNLDQISYADADGALEGSAAAVWNRDFSVIDGSFVLTDSGETEGLAGDFFYELGVLDFHGVARTFKADRFVGSGNDLRFSGEIYGGLSGEGYYSVGLSLESLTGRAGSSRFSCSAEALLDSERFVVSQVLLSINGVETKIPYLLMDRGAGRLETEVHATGSVNNKDLGAALSLGVNFTPIDTWPEFKKAISSFSGIVDVRYAFVGKKETDEPFSFIFSRTRMEGEEGPALIRLSGGPENMVNLVFQETLSSGGNMVLSLSNPSPVQGNLSGIIDGTNIDILAKEVFIDLGSLWDILPIKDIVFFNEGIITGETRIYGSIFDPEFAGSAWGSGIILSVPDYVAARIGPGSGSIILEGNEITFGPVTAPCGKGNGIISGSMQFNRWIPGYYLDIDVDREIPFDLNISGIIAKGNAKGVINLFMENNETLTITGNVETSDTEITFDSAENEIAMARSHLSREVDIIANVRVVAGQRMEFFWPNSKTPLLRAYGGMGTGIRIIGDTRIPHFSVDGDIALRGGELYHFQRSFYIREGILRFYGNEPQVDPRISVRAEIRDRNDDGPVTIAMIMENVPLSALSTSLPRFESSPSLSQLEIYSLLGQAPPSGAVETQNLNPLFNATVEVILQSVVFSWVERQVRNTLGLDMFTFR
ncbi:MAG: translocation/assembly module TamB, partial [Spirochaetaceae bacterium]|nr:translocation/assembly module TamB [Spirochaetaceae bacterium]